MTETSIFPTTLPSDQTQNINTNSVVPKVSDLSSDVPKELLPQQYLAFLNETWQTTKPQVLEQLMTLTQVALDGKVGTITTEQQLQAHQIAHKLAGTLGIFWLTHAMQMARQLESLLDKVETLNLQSYLLMGQLVTDLYEEIEQTTIIQMAHVPKGATPLFLMVSSDTEMNTSLQIAANHCGVELQIFPLPVQADVPLLLESNFEMLARQPDAIIFRLPKKSDNLSPSSVRSYPQDLSQVWQTLGRCYPDVPVLVIGDQGGLENRMEALRWGGKVFLEAQTSPQQMIEICIQFLGRINFPNKVMILDDDQEWLYTVPTMLKPWGFKVTTLADVEQFWTILHAVTPDALILDIKMPQINGFDICRLLRSDPQWHRLPILFLSALSDVSSQRQAFKVGADDYLCKPVMGGELADRILNRLQRRVA